MEDSTLVLNQCFFNVVTLLLKLKQNEFVYYRCLTCSTPGIVETALCSPKGVTSLWHTNGLDFLASISVSVIPPSPNKENVNSSDVCHFKN